MCVHYLLEVHKEARRGHQIPWNWSYKWLSTRMQVLRITPESSASTAREESAPRQAHWQDRVP